MFESRGLPEALAQTRIVRARHDRPLCEWSTGNQLLAFLHSTADARGYRQWQEVGRHVKKGAKAFAILAPCTVRKTETDVDGREAERVIVTGFRAVPVFRLEDTEGEPVVYPDYSPPQLPPLHDVAERLGVRLRYSPTGRERGSYSLVNGGIVLGTHDVPDPYEQPGRFQQFTYSPRAKDAETILGAARVTKEA
jgi:hypothetical protein